MFNAKFVADFERCAAYFVEHVRRSAMRTATYKSTDLEVPIFLTYGGLRYKLTQRAPAQVLLLRSKRIPPLFALAGEVDRANALSYRRTFAVRLNNNIDFKQRRVFWT